MQKKSFMRGPGLWLVLLLLVVVMVQMLMWPTQVENKEISYSEFLQLVQDEKISQLMVSEYNAYGLYKDSTISESSFPERYDFTLQIPNDVASFYDDVKQVWTRRASRPWTMALRSSTSRRRSRPGGWSGFPSSS